MVSKASEMNPFSTLYMGELAIKAGIPPGVLNVLVAAAEAGVALSSHLKIPQDQLHRKYDSGQEDPDRSHAMQLKNVTLELGGKSPVLVCADADMKTAIEGSSGFLALNGQGCILGTRIYVHKYSAKEFVEGLKTTVEGYVSTLGADPQDKTTMSSPIYHSGQKETVMKYIAQGKTEAELITGGEAFGKNGCYVKPTLFFKPKPGARIVSEEVFGQVAVIDTFQTEADVVKRANDTEYGLGSSLYTKDLSRAMRVSAALETGVATVNNSQPWHPTMPFGRFKARFSNQNNTRDVKAILLIE